MRNVWMIVSSFAVAVAIGGAVYYFFPRQPTAITPSASQMPSTEGHVLILSTGNPLLSAVKGQLDRWVPFYPIRCGEILFEKSDPKAQHFEFCINEIQRRVSGAAGKDLSREDVLDPRVKAHWREVMGAQ
ncbi:hypothetical protein [Achromobacter sp. NCFB-sbj8-Ac1-l]|uniref:hypothetical protein n=1 Tax=unclassified Achromobacter TaxID=2626865 RepID=UPI004046A778